MINQNIDMSSAITLHRLLTFAFVTLMTDESSTLADARQGEICLCFLFTWEKTRVIQTSLELSSGLLLLD